jgi:PGF-pre-PGF domain-containing protein
MNDVYMYEISTVKTTRITTSTCAEFPSIYDDKIIYADSRNDPDHGDETDIYLYDLSAEATIKPIASFTSNVTSGTSPLSVQFTDKSENAVSWEWDFENDGDVDSTDKNPINVYTTPGNYTVRLTVSNENGTDSKTQKIIVQYSNDFPVAVPSANTTSGYILLCVQFTDLSQNITSRSWDIGNDGIVDSTDASFIYEFSSKGTYPVKLTVTNASGSSSEIVTISALSKSTSSSGSSSGGSSGGSAGGSPEPAKNVKSKELCQVFITSGKAVKFDFAKKATSIVSLNFDSKKTVGKTTTVVEMLKNKSTLTKETPEGEVYNYLNIWVGNGGYGSDEDNLENAVVNFKVEKAWIKDKSIDKSSIVLNRYSDKKWNALPTTSLSEDDKYLYFKAETPRFSPFAITGNSTENKTDVKVQPETEDKKEGYGCTAGNVEQQPETKENTSTPEKTTSTPGFEIAYCIACLFGVFLYRRQKT